MPSNLFDKLEALDNGDEIEITLLNDPTKVGGVTLESPLTTTIQLITERRLDHQKGHDVDGMVTRKEYDLEIPDHDDIHGEYVIRTDRPMVGENSVTGIEAREYFTGRPGDGEYSIHTIGFTDVKKI